MNRRTTKLTIPAIRAIRRAIETNTLVEHLIKTGEETNCNSVSVSYSLLNKPWDVTIEVNKHKHQKHDKSKDDIRQGI